MAVARDAYLALILLAVWLPGRPVFAAAAVSARPAAVRGSLTELGGLLTSALPGLPKVDLSAVPGERLALAGLPLPQPDPSGRLPLVPASLDARRAAVLVELARRAEPVAAQGGPKAYEVLEAVNAVFKDIPPQALADFPEERLNALSSMVFDVLAGRPSSAKSAAVLSDLSLARIESLRGKPLRQEDHNPHRNPDGEALLTTWGVPDYVRRVEAEGSVFRHYTNEGGLRGILDADGLRNGVIPYFEVMEGEVRTAMRRSFKDLAGIFLTKPDVDGDRVGRPKKELYAYYVDLLLPARLPLLEIERGAIFLVPFPLRTQPWILNLYRRWASGQTVDKGYFEGIRRVEESGGPGPDVTVPMRIIRHGEVP
ncbi:MAG: hypothetical protein PHF00_09640 [Elusimicrobia bacterium]|nr:hypothetical protein [Elusimicrobiota bacterium]